MKTCSKCKETKDTTLFYKRKLSPDGFAHSCKVCSDFAANRTVKANKPKYYAFREQTKIALKARIDAWKAETGCLICPENDPCCLQLHHLDPTVKEGHPSDLMTSWDRYMKEAEKCVIVCANCHDKIHASKISLLVVPLG